jgi:4-amino-4-deoxychorismate lyase
LLSDKILETKLFGDKMAANIINDQVKFLETIKSHRGVCSNLDLHAQRIARTFQKYFRKEPNFNITQILPQNLGDALTKVRLIYGPDNYEITAEKYNFPIITDCRLAETDLYYGEKFLDRTAINNLKTQSQASEVIFVQKGRITDSSIANLVLADSLGRLFTPEHFLLPGVKRAYYLKTGRIKTKDILVQDLPAYERLYFINSLIDLEDNISLNPRDIRV